MKKRALQLASVASMIDQFNMSNIQILQNLGYKVDVVADFTNPGTISNERAYELGKRLNSMGVRVIDIPIPRSINPKAIFGAYRKVRELLLEQNYSIVHCHSPIGGAITRIAAKSERQKGTKVIYTAHGFHFYKGAPLKNWVVFYPIEKWLSKYTDVLITITKEDYKRASEKLKARKTVYVPGVGINTEKFKPNLSRRKIIRNELGLDDSQFLILSVGELNENKNHIAVIKALKDIPSVTYVIVGKGELKDYLETKARENGVDLRLMGFREDVADFYKAADIYILPSIREGLNVSLMEAMASGLPVACSRIRGNVDLVEEAGGVFFNPNNTIEIRQSVNQLLHEGHIPEEYGKYNRDAIRSLSAEVINQKIINIYTTVDKGK